MSLMQSAPLYAGRRQSDGQGRQSQTKEEQETGRGEQGDEPDAMRLAFISLIGWHLPCRRCRGLRLALGFDSDCDSVVG